MATDNLTFGLKKFLNNALERMPGNEAWGMELYCRPVDMIRRMDPDMTLEQAADLLDNVQREVKEEMVGMERGGLGRRK